MNLAIRNTKKTVGFAVCLMLVLTGALIWAWQSGYLDLAKDSTVPALTEVCQEKQATKSACHADYFKDITAEYGPEAAFGQLREAYESVPSVKTNCHPLTHVIGRAAAEMHEGVPEAYARGDNFCWSGYYHGVMEQVMSGIDDGDVESKANDICVGEIAEDKYSFYHYNCVHGLGHGFMLVTNNELFDSLEMCDLLVDDWERQSCYGGVFMENIMSHSQDNIGHSTVYIKDDNPLYPCTDVGKAYKQQCYAMQTSHALDVVGRDFGKVFELCAGVEAAYVSTCYRSLGRDASGSTVSDIEGTREICMMGGDDMARKHCFEGAVKDFISYHHDDTEAKALCDSLEYKFRGNCHDTAREYFRSF